MSRAATKEGKSQARTPSSEPTNDTISPKSMTFLKPKRWSERAASTMTRHDGIAEHQQVRLGQAHVVLYRNIVERDVHERLHQRGKQVAREQHHDHRLAVFCGLLVLNSHSGNSILYCGRLKPGAFTRGAPAVDAPPPPATTSEAAAACFVADAFAPTRRKHVALCTKKS